MAIQVADVVSEYGAFYKNEGQNKASLFNKLYRPSVTESFFQRLPTNDTVVRLGNSSLDRALQPFQKAFTPVGTITFKPHVIELDQFKIDKREYPDELVHSWLGFLEGEGIDRKQWPFVRWMLEVHVFPKATEEYELFEAWGGVKETPVNGVAGALGTAANGLAKRLDDKADEVNTIIMGAPPTDPADICEYFEEFAAKIDPEYRKRIDYIFTNENLELAYKQGKRRKYNANYKQADELLSIEDFPNIKVQGLPSMGASNTLFATLKENRVAPIKKSDGNSAIVGEYSPREVSIYTDFHKALDFKFYGAVFVNDQI
jgi:hypothetical protein